MYVALTRARRRLYLSLAQSRMLHGQTRYNIPSRFLEEIPEALILRLNSRRRGFGEHAAVEPDTGAAPAYAMPPASPWRVGQNVMHAKFGPGVIVNAEGRGADARVQVNFRSAGLKWLALEYAKLTPA
jgi:DNA helicase-2/ATP-dependent DNA helicase PcrA